jgi:hypothetical protein
MLRDRAFGVLLMAAMSGGLLGGCTSRDGTSVSPTPTTPSHDLLVGAWIAEYSDHSIGVLEFRSNGTVTFASGPTLGTADELTEGGYRAEPGLLTYLGGSDCEDPTDTARYAYVLADDQITFSRTGADDPCTGREADMAAPHFTRKAAWVQPSSSPLHAWASLIAREADAMRRTDTALQALEATDPSAGMWQPAALESEINSVARSVGTIAGALNELLLSAMTTLGQPPVEVSGLVDSMLAASEEAEDSAFDTNEDCDGGDPVQPECARAALRLAGASSRLVRELDYWTPHMRSPAWPTRAQPRESSTS